MHADRVFGRDNDVTGGQDLSRLGSGQFRDLRSDPGRRELVRETRAQRTLSQLVVAQGRRRNKTTVRMRAKLRCASLT